MKNYLNSHFQFRFNHLREATEWRRIDAEAPEHNTTQSEWKELNKWALNSIYGEVTEAGFEVTYADLKRMLHSCFCDDLHPFGDYLANLPRWDGLDRVTPLAHRVCDDPLWTLVLHRWMLAMVAQWKGLDMQTANSMVPVLVSERQGLGKSTFWRSIVPPELQNYYLDKLDFTTSGEYDRMMAQCCLINLDEMDMLSDRAMSKFKAATQMKSITGHSTLRTRITVGRRMASFCATTNKIAILRDRTGSRRFFCQEVKAKISFAKINHRQLYAQLLAELAKGERTWFIKAEERSIQQHNRAFYANTPFQKTLLKLYRAPMEFDAPGEILEVTAQDMMRTLAKRHPTLLLGLNMKEFGRQASALFPQTKRTKAGRLYKVVPLSA